MALRIPKNLELKLLIKQGCGQVLYAEAGEDFVDFLSSLFGLPLGLAACLLSDDHQVAGCLPTLDASYHSLDDAYFLHSGAGSSSQSTTADNVFYRCSGANNNSYYFDNYIVCLGNYGHVTDEYGTICPACKKEMTTKMRLVPGSSGAVKVKQGKASEAGGGCVKGAVTYMVMDNLAVTPMSTISAIDLLNKFQVKDLNSLRGFIVGVGKREAMELFKASFQSKTVLTDVFLKKGDEKRCHYKLKRKINGENLAVTPMSTIFRQVCEGNRDIHGDAMSAIDLPNKFQVRDPNSLRGFIMAIGKREMFYQRRR